MTHGVDFVGPTLSPNGETQTGCPSRFNSMPYRLWVAESQDDWMVKLEQSYFGAKTTVPLEASQIREIIALRTQISHERDIQEILSMNTFKTSPMTPAKPWSKPTITVIDLRSARSGVPGVSDNGNNSKS